jgi:hypothetical protein
MRKYIVAALLLFAFTANAQSPTPNQIAAGKCLKLARDQKYTAIALTAIGGAIYTVQELQFEPSPIRTGFQIVGVGLMLGGVYSQVRSIHNIGKAGKFLTGELPLSVSTNEGIGIVYKF